MLREVSRGGNHGGKVVVEQIQSEGLFHARVPEHRAQGIIKLFEHIRNKMCEQITRFTCILVEDPTRGITCRLDHACTHQFGYLSQAHFGRLGCC